MARQPPTPDPDVPLRLLLVEDSELDAKLLLRTVRQAGYVVEHRRVDTAVDLDRALASEPWDAIVSDYSMPGFNGLQALAIAIESGLDLPFIIVSGTVGEDVAVGTMKAGAHDYLLKDNLTRLVPAIEREMREAQMRATSREAGRQLRRSEEKYRSLVESASEHLFMLDRDGVFAASNWRSFPCGRVTSGPLAGHALEDILPPEEAERYRGHLGKVFRTGEPVEFEHELVESGGLRHHADTLYPIHGEHGITYVGGICRDITELKNAEAESLDLQAQLVQAQRLEAIGTLAGGVAHEINNPVNGVMGYADLILRRLAPDSREAEFAQEIKHETNRIATIVRNLLSFARQENELPAHVRLGEVIDATLSLVRTVMRHDQIALDIEVGDDLPCVNCRSQQLQQVLMNLMTNARDALNERYPKHDGNKTLVLKAETFQHDGREWARITVEDHGTGISPEVQERMFDPFFTTKPRDRGTGLGLSISHGIITEHGGRLSVDSKPGEYTRFHVELPTAETYAAETPGDAP
ncbi:MAG: PAS domain-containing protein [Lentisphaerae bacterium]|jgi:PAS domain S-box-containing protein|nr:PAS domain-containing protein [Lentisphaerota bacterium]MBT5606879.1 PAS domain-containing protein [Lentisphaerota bacterium]MBT7058325.1 PAS domain-containing protein [Lentisphaerota bacterium]MBT7843598.1 PAS domain-containing protein [Lentisphaerota bacterium]